MIAAATTTISVYRDTTTDDYGDPVDTNTGTPESTGVPCAINEKTRRVTTADSATPRIVRWHAGRVAAGTDIQTDDRIKDEQTNDIYFVDAVTSTSVAHGLDMLLDLRKQD